MSYTSRVYTHGNGCDDDGMLHAPKDFLEKWVVMPEVMSMLARLISVMDPRYYTASAYEELKEFAGKMVDCEKFVQELISNFERNTSPEFREEALKEIPRVIAVLVGDHNPRAAEKMLVSFKNCSGLE